MSLLPLQSELFGFGVVTSIGENIVPEFSIEEIRRGSTFNTNKHGLELFAVMVSCFGTGIPLAYFILEAGKEGGNKSRE